MKYNRIREEARRGERGDIWLELEWDSWVEKKLVQKNYAKEKDRVGGTIVAKSGGDGLKKIEMLTYTNQGTWLVRDESWMVVGLYVW